MTDTARLVIAVDSSGAAKATANLDKLDRAAGNSERATNKLGLAWGKFIGTLVSGYAVQSATRYFIRQADAMANMNAKLKLVTGSTIAATAAQRDLFDLSQKTSADLEATTDLYVKLGQSSRDLAGNHALLLGITEKVSKALVISGADAAASTAVIRQFSQAMAAGSLRGDEFISVMEGAPRLARAIADGMGVAVGSLRSLAAQGKLTSAEIIKALEDQGATLDREFGAMPLTVARATQQVRNALTEMIGDTDNATEASRGLATNIAALAHLLESDETKQAFKSIVSGIVSVTSALVTATVKTAEAISALREYFGLAEKRSTVMLRNQRDDLEGKLFAEERSQGKVGKTLLGQTMLPGVGPLLGAVGAMVNAGDQERIDNLRKQIAEIDAIIDSREKKATDDYAKYRGLDPKFGLSVNQNGAPHGVAAATASTAALSAQNKEKERALTLDEQWAVLQAEVYDPAYVEQQNALATAWADQGKAVEQATEKMSVFADQAARNIQSSLGDSLYEILGGKFDSIADRFSDMLRRIAAEAASAKIFEMLGAWASGYTGAGAGWINALGKAATATAGGRADSGPVMAGQSYWVGEKGKRELFTPSQNGTISQGGGAVTVKPIINVTIERGAARDEVQTKPNGSGGMDLVVKIKEMVERGIAGGIADGSSPVGSAMRQRYGLREAV